MEEKNMVMGSLLCCLIGTFMIILISENIEVPVYPIGEVNLSMEGSEVIVQGYLYGITNSEKFTKFNIKDTSGSLTSIIFDKEIRLRENSFVQVKGEVTVFNNRTEITAKEIYAS